MEEHQLISAAMVWMRDRGWREKIAKSSSGQSLYEHSLIELDVFLRLAPFLRDPKHYGLTEIEERILVVALIVHDAGKEMEEWQRYVSSKGGGPKISHICPDLSLQLVPGICAAIGYEDLSAQVHQVIANCAGMHHDRPGRSDGAILGAMLAGVPARVVTLANIVKAVDHLCSAESPTDAERCLESDAGFQKHFKITTHQLVLRGVSSTLLHRAAQSTFERAGWTPLLYFATGTAYISDIRAATVDPSADEIAAALTTELDTALKRDITSLIVGSPTGNILPKPELVSFVEIRDYLSSAGGKIGPTSFSKKKLADKRKVITEYFRLTGRTESPSDTIVGEEANRISVAQPEMLVFKLFKALLDPGKVTAVGADGFNLAQAKYDAAFGVGRWADLQSTSTLMAAKDMARTVDPYWRLPGSTVGSPASTVEQIPDKERIEGLVRLLAAIAESVFAELGRPSPREQLAGKMAGSFVGDLLTPADAGNLQESAALQLHHYRSSKPSAGKELSGSLYTCPVCNIPFVTGSGFKASADFIDNPQTHTNRGVSHGSFNYVMVCATCYYERILRQLLLGQPLAELITIAPRLNLGPTSGARLLDQIRNWVDSARSAGNAEIGFSWSFTDNAARIADGKDPFGMSPEELVQLFRYRYSAETKKKRRTEALRELKATFSDLDELNEEASASFPDWDAALDALVAGEIDLQECRSIRRRIMGQSETEVIPQTPNLILFPLSREIASEKESETNKSLRRLYVTLILSVAFEASVSITRVSDISDFSRRPGAAYVPPVPALRSLVRSEWIGVAESRYWLGAIGAAAQLARETNLPPRSNIYTVLSAEPAEQLIRRLEQDGKTATPHQLELISRLPGFHRAQKEKTA